MKHGRLVAVVLSPQAANLARAGSMAGDQERNWGGTHMIPPDRARAAQMLKVPRDFDEE